MGLSKESLREELEEQKKMEKEEEKKEESEDREGYRREKNLMLGLAPQTDDTISFNLQQIYMCRSRIIWQRRNRFTTRD